MNIQPITPLRYHHFFLQKLLFSSNFSSHSHMQQSLIGTKWTLAFLFLLVKLKIKLKIWHNDLTLHLKVHKGMKWVNHKGIEKNWMYLCLVARMAKWGMIEKFLVGKNPSPNHFLSSIFSPHPGASNGKEMKEFFFFYIEMKEINRKILSNLILMF